MIINDNGRIYTTESMIEIANKDPDNRDSIERELLYAFNRLIYLRYVNLRQIVSDNHCQKMKPDQVREKLNINKINVYYDCTEEEVMFYIDYASEFIQIVG